MIPTAVLAGVLLKAGSRRMPDLSTHLALEKLRELAEAVATCVAGLTTESALHQPLHFLETLRFRVTLCITKAAHATRSNKAL